MNHPDDIVYCLSCRKPMMRADAVCPHCSANQDAVRSGQLGAQRASSDTAPSYGPTPWRYCPNCRGQVALASPSCPYCGFAGPWTAPQPIEDITVYIVLGVVFALISLLFCPIGFAGGGIAFGVTARNKNPSSPAGLYVVALSIFCGIIGVIIGVFVWTRRFSS